MPPKRTFARLDAFTRGQIWGMKLGGMPREEMLEHVWKKDGTELTLHTLDDVIKKKTDYRDWMGDDSSVSYPRGRWSVRRSEVRGCSVSHRGALLRSTS